MDSDGTCDTQLTAIRTLIPSGERRSDGYHGVYLSEEARDRGEYCLDTDQLGRPRPQGACDIGAIEWQEDD